MVYLGNTGHDCNFDVNFCPTWITNATGKHFEWRRHQGKTSSIGTGPRFDHTTKSDQGYYVYIESSYPAQENDTAWLVGQNILNPQGFCLSFWYHMYGPHAGTLNVYVSGVSVHHQFRRFSSDVQLFCFSLLDLSSLHAIFFCTTLDCMM